MPEARATGVIFYIYGDRQYNRVQDLPYKFSDGTIITRVKYNSEDLLHKYENKDVSKPVTNDCLESYWYDYWTTSDDGFGIWENTYNSSQGRLRFYDYPEGYPDGATLSFTVTDSEGIVEENTYEGIWMKKYDGRWFLQESEITDTDGNLLSNGITLTTTGNAEIY